jgi:putative zinc finger protein
MTSEFPDELLSAFLDNELSPTERAQVEQHLAASESDRQLLAELKSLRAEVAGLPPVAVNADFADRVVRAAFAEAEKQSGVIVGISPARRPSRRWIIGAAVASGAALAVCVLLIAQPWSNTGPATPIVKTAGPTFEQALGLKDQFVKTIGDVLPAEGEAVVLRLQVSKDVPLAAALDAALGKAGIAPLAANVSTSAAQWQDAYRRALESKLAASAGSPNDNLLNSTAAAAEALFVEAPLERLEGVLNELSAGSKQPMQLNAIGKLALAGGPSSRDPGAEGESGSQKPFAQRLNASLFRLEKTIAKSATAAIAPRSTGPMPKPQQTVRVLILVEAQ